jgi:aerobic-type carbon monoxide dehydrogenase small subunit (CoxS/CutS family)
MGAVKIRCIVNDKVTPVESEPQRSLLEVLREDLALTGTKYGCGEGACGACTVLVDGKRVLSCQTTISDVAEKRVTTIEGLSSSGALHAVQEAFLEEGAFQCGYCTTGMIMSAAALLEENPQPDEAQAVEWMNQNICRCGGYSLMLRAIARAAGSAREEVMP